MAFSSYSWLPRSGTKKSLPVRISAVLRFLAVLSLIPIMAGMGAGDSGRESGGDPPAVIVVLDISSSMTAEDFDPISRLHATKQALRAFLLRNPGAEIGLIVFASAPRLLAPPTPDHQALLEILESIHPAAHGEDGTAIGSGIASAVNRLRDGPWSRQSILLLTDGVNNRGAVSPDDAARIARQFGITIDVVGIGTDNPTRYYVPAADGSSEALLARIEIDERALENIAQQTHGSYFRAKNSSRLIQGLQSRSLEGQEREPTAKTGLNTSRSQAFAGFSLLFMGIQFVLVHFFLSEIPG